MVGGKEDMVEMVEMVAGLVVEEKEGVEKDFYILYKVLYVSVFQNDCSTLL